MTNEVIWTKLVLERFIQLANLTEEEEIVIRTRAGGFDVFEMAQNFNGGRKRGGIHAGKPARKEPGWALERVEA